MPVVFRRRESRRHEMSEFRQCGKAERAGNEILICLFPVDDGEPVFDIVRTYIEMF